MPSSKPPEAFAEFPEGRLEAVISAFEVLFEPQLGLGYSSLLAPPSSLVSLLFFLLHFLPS